MFSIEQVALRTTNIARDIEKYKAHGHTDWIQDRVHAVHLFASHKHGWAPHLGQDFEVSLAFNYTMLQGQEFELISLHDGMTYQFLEQGPRMSHLGYHVADQSLDPAVRDTLLVELERLQALGGVVVQVSQTTTHKNTSKRYRYAYVTGLLGIDRDVPIKVIQRIEPPSSPGRMARSVSEGRELFSCLEV